MLLRLLLRLRTQGRTWEEVGRLFGAEDHRSNCQAVAACDAPEFARGDPRHRSRADPAAPTERRALLYALLGCNKRERLFGKKCDARRVLDPSSALTLGAVKAEATRLRGDEAHGRDFSRNARAGRAVPTLDDYLNRLLWSVGRAESQKRCGDLARIKACFADEFGADKLNAITAAASRSGRAPGNATAARPRRLTATSMRCGGVAPAVKLKFNRRSAGRIGALEVDKTSACAEHSRPTKKRNCVPRSKPAT